MDKILSHRLFRIYDWWEYKIPQILIPVYLVILNSDYIIDNSTSFHLFFKLLFGLVLGAITVSIIGEYFDTKQDLLANKKNGFKNLSNKQSMFVLLFTALINFCFLFFIKTEPKIFYLLSIITFFFYYVPIIRLKEKGFLGVLADSLGSHVFPAIFVFSHLISIQTILRLEYCIFLFWVFLFGIRGILNHQYTDFENDKKSNTKTFVLVSSEKTRKRLQKTILIIEMLLFSFLLFYTIKPSLLLIGLLVYLLILFARKMLYNNAIVYFNIKRNRSFSIFLFEFYSVFLPTLLIIQIYTINQVAFWSLLIFHIIITFKKIISILKELKESINFILQ